MSGRLMYMAGIVAIGIGSGTYIFTPILDNIARQAIEVNRKQEVAAWEAQAKPKAEDAQAKSES
eukprot:m.129690 g.129690  ORF g.129690 m.129690 type:complete len:64 (+) comp29418_c1_seq1:154-345(+)